MMVIPNCSAIFPKRTELLGLSVVIRNFENKVYIRKVTGGKIEKLGDKKV